MSSQMQAFGSWRIILLNSDDLGDDGDVLTRVGANGTAFRPGGGGGGAAWGDITGTLSAQTDLQAALDAVTFDQDLNTDDAVVFGSVELSGPLLFPQVGSPLATEGHVRATAEGLDIFVRNGDDNGNIRVARLKGSSTIIGSSAIGAFQALGIDWSLTGADTFISGSNSFGIEIGTTDLPIYLSPGTGALNIDGTPGITDAAIVVDGVTLSFTKGILTGVA